MTSRRAVLLLFLAFLRVSAGAAADLHTPTRVWRSPLQGWGEPAADGSSIYVLARGHELVSLDRATGAPVWRVPTGGPGEATWGSVVRLAGSRVIVGDDAVVAFDRATGREAWRVVPPSGPGSGPYLGESRAGLVLLGSPNGRIHAVDTETGRVRWTRTVASARAPITVFAPAWIGGRIMASFTTYGQRLTGGVAAFDAGGRCVWRRKLAGAGASGAPVELSDAAIVAQTDGAILAFDAATGRRVWSLPKLHSSDPRQPLIRDVRALAATPSLLVAGSLTGAVIAYDAATRQERWRYDDGPDGAAPLRLRVDRRTAYVPFTNGVLVALDLETGRERWRAGGANDALPWPPAITADAVIAAGDEGIVAFAREEVPASAGADRQDNR
jgi:outer membrane protein assembly factor BamB